MSLNSETETKSEDAVASNVAELASRPQGLKKWDIPDLLWTWYESLPKDHESMTEFKAAVIGYMHDKKYPHHRENLALLLRVAEHHLQAPSAELLNVDPLQSRKGLGSTKASRKELALELGKAFVDNLMTATVEPVDGTSGMRVMKDMFILHPSPNYKTILQRHNLLIRKVTERFWLACIKRLNNPGMRFRVCASGTSGIGKTMTTAYFIRMLLKLGETVVYHIRQENETETWIYEFTPTVVETSINSDGTKSVRVADHIKVAVYSVQEMNTKCIESLWEPSTYYIVDPKDTIISCNPAPIFLPKVTIVAPPDSRHWGGEDFEDFRNDMGVVMVLPDWEWDEVREASPYIKSSVVVGDVVLEKKEILEERALRTRFDQVGGVPRRVFANDATLGIRLRKIERALMLLPLEFEQVEKIYCGFVGSMGTMDPSDWKAQLVGYKAAEPDFMISEAFIISQEILDHFHVTFLENIWIEMESYNLVKGKRALLERYLYYLLAPKSNERRDFKCCACDVLHDVHAYDEMPLWKRLCCGKSDKEVCTNLSTVLKLGGCKEIRLAVDVCESAKAGDKNFLYVSEAYNRDKLIDCMYLDEDGHYHAFKVVTEDTHKVGLAQVKKLEKIIDNPEKLCMYYAVPDFNFEKLVTLFDTTSTGSSDIGEMPICKMYHLMIPRPDDVYDDVSK